MEKNEILAIYGDDPETMSRRIAEEAGLESLIGDRRKRVGLKPNLVVSRTADGGATTHPEIARGLIGYLQSHGFTDVTILEGSWVGDDTDQAFKVCGYKQLAEETGVAIINLQKDTAHPRDCRGMKIEICDAACDVDFMINLPVLKGHCQTLVTCALKNNKGVISNREKRRFHTLGLHQPIAHLNAVAKNDFILVDSICGDLDFEEGGNPVPAGRLFGSRDPVLCDAWGATLLGYRADEIPYIGLAEKLGIGCGNPKQARIRELNHSSQGALFPRPQGRVRERARYIREDKACSACYAGLVFALSRITQNELSRLKEPISIGQGFKGKKGTLGVGQCAANFAAFCGGCPPNAREIADFLQAVISR
ncbi:MAG: DUF362 domain-containing protein [Spirochaetaceae bacterium]|jgi:uncharacterized protein (DUF362 family)|nr:DUF362 domain-containing protein [Spirochaetaceae bacterium]